MNIKPDCSLCISLVVTARPNDIFEIAQIACTLDDWFDLEPCNESPDRTPHIVVERLAAGKETDDIITLSIATAGIILPAAFADLLRRHMEAAR